MKQKVAAKHFYEPWCCRPWRAAFAIRQALFLPVHRAKYEKVMSLQKRIGVVAAAALQ